MAVEAKLLHTDQSGDPPLIFLVRYHAGLR